jgi:hypothetical protein
MNDDNYMGCDCGGEHHTVGSHRAWCLDCTEWCYPGDGMQCEIAVLRAENVTLKDSLAAVNKIQQEWWEGYIPMNVALSEIREVFRP